jgi:protein SCO1
LEKTPALFPAFAGRPIRLWTDPEFHPAGKKRKTFKPAGFEGESLGGRFYLHALPGPLPAANRPHGGTPKRISIFSRAPVPGLRFVSFSVDPAFDTPEVLSKYADTYGADPARWYFLTGETEQVYQLVRHGFHLAIQQNEAGREKPEEAITHSVSFVLVDGNGSIRGYYEGTDADDMKRLRKDILSFK